VLKLSRDYLAALNEERELRAELLDLQLYGQDDEHIKAAVIRHDELIDKIEQLRQTRMIPVLRDLVDFVAEQQNGPRDTRDELLGAMKRGRRKVRRKVLKDGMVARKLKRKRKKARAQTVPMRLAVAS
jgi:hypothetical protein